MTETLSWLFPVLGVLIAVCGLGTVRWLIEKERRGRDR